MHRRLAVLLVTAAVLLSTVSAQSGSVIRVATIGEPPSLDAMSTTADLTATITQHIFETLYAFGEAWDIVPLIAAELPQISDDGTVIDIPLRSGLTFHDGSELDSADVVASLQRWMDLSPRGRAVAESLVSLEAVDAENVRITLSEPFSPLLSYLAINTAAAIIIPEELAATRDPLNQYVGSGPFAFVEWQPDRYIRLQRFDGYVPRDEARNGYGGGRQAMVDEVRFVPVPDASTRLAGLLGGEYDFADNLNTEAYGQLSAASNVEAEIVNPFAFPIMILNVAEGALTDVSTRRAAQAALDLEAMLIAGYGDPQFFALEGSYYPQGSQFYTDAGTEYYNNYDPQLAERLLAESGYDGAPFRILTSHQYEFLYRMSVVAAQNLEEAGFTVDLQTVEWATLVDRRSDPGAWEAYFTFGSFIPEPSAYSFLVGPGWGQWQPEEKVAILDAYNTTYDPAERVENWSRLQELLYTDVPVVKIGDSYSLTGRSASLNGYLAKPWPAFWNVEIE